MSVMEDMLDVTEMVKIYLTATTVMYTCFYHFRYFHSFNSFFILTQNLHSYKTRGFNKVDNKIKEILLGGK